MSDSEQFERELQKSSLIIKHKEPLALYSTIRVGGKARFFIIVSDSTKLKKAIILANTYQIPYFIVGKGSNIIFSDNGYDGLVIVNRSKKWHILREDKPTENNKTVSTRFDTLDENFKKVFDKEPVDSSVVRIIIRVDSGVGINYLSQTLYKRDISGLEWFAGIPSSVGGAIYMNMHGGNYFFGDLVDQATILREDKTVIVSRDYFQFDYDWSILHQTGEIVLDADLSLRKGNVANAKKTAREWASYKASQPRCTAGCIFRNLDETEQKILDLPTPSVGYVIDKVLKLKGTRIGNAIISNDHAAFIENLGKATASDVFNLIQLIKNKAKSELGIDLIEEVKLIGKF